LKKLVQDVLGYRIVAVTIPMWIAKIGAKIMPLYYKLTKRIPKFTDYSLETLQSNSDISSGKAKRELGYAPRDLATTIKDTIRWLIQKKERAGIR
jgi:dihydroflavonol-4-reductase